MNDTINDILVVEGLHIYDIKNTEDKIELYISLEKKKEQCPRCKSSKNRIDNYYTQTIKDLDVLGKPTYFMVKKHRYRCSECGKKFIRVMQ